MERERKEGGGEDTVKNYKNKWLLVPGILTESWGSLSSSVSQLLQVLQSLRRSGQQAGTFSPQNTAQSLCCSAQTHTQTHVSRTAKIQYLIGEPANRPDIP